MAKQKNILLSDQIIGLLSQVSEIYNNHLDQSWMNTLEANLDMTRQDYNDIRYALSIVDPTYKDLPVINHGIDALNKYISELQEHVLPNVSDLLIDRYDNKKFDKMTKETRVTRKLIAYALPIKVDQLKNLVQELKETIPKINSSTLRKIIRMKSF